MTLESESILEYPLCLHVSLLQPRPQAPTQTRGFVARLRQFSISHETAQHIKAPGDEAVIIVFISRTGNLENAYLFI